MTCTGYEDFVQMDDMDTLDDIMVDSRVYHPNDSTTKSFDNIDHEKSLRALYFEDQDQDETMSYSEFTTKSAMEQMKDKINEDRLNFCIKYIY